MRPPLFVGQRRQPLINSQKITLKHGASQGVSDQVLRMLLKKLVQQFQGFVVRGTTEQIFGFFPQVRIKFVAPVMTAISGVSHIKQTKQPVPNLIRIRSVYFQIRMGNALWLALELVLRLAMRLTANNLSFAGVLNAYLRPNKREEAQHKNAGPDT
jgi:hypothetical protein